MQAIHPIKAIDAIVAISCGFLLATWVSAGAGDAKTVKGDADVLFYCSYDKDTLKPDIAKGGDDYNGAVPVQFTEGFKGKALVTGHKQNAVYPLEGNLSIAQGTVKFWVMPVDWNGAEEGFHHFFIIRADEAPVAKDPETRIFSFLLYKFLDWDKICAFGMAGELEGERLLSIPTGEAWAPKKWHQVAFAWDSKGAALYVDGDERSVSYLKKAPDTLGARNFIVGGPYFGPNDTLTAIDELYIFNRRMSGGEIKEKWQADLAGKK